MRGRGGVGVIVGTAVLHEEVVLTGSPRVRRPRRRRGGKSAPRATASNRRAPRPASGRRLRRQSGRQYIRRVAALPRGGGSPDLDVRGGGAAPVEPVG